MAFTFLADETWDDGTRGSFDSETDVSNILDFPHYQELARQGFAPWMGAHALRIRLNGTAVGYVTETGAWDTAAAGTIHSLFTVLIGEDVTIAASGAIVIFAMMAGATQEVSFGVRNNGGVYELYVTDSVTTRTFPIVRSNKRWYEVELSTLIDNAGSDNGTIDWYIDGFRAAAQITGADQGAITDLNLGAFSGTSAGDKGTILIGNVMADDARIYPRRQKRFACDKWITKDITAFIGNGQLDACSITGTSSDAVLNIYDTDIFESTGIGFSRAPLIYTRNVTTNDQSPGMTTPIRFTKGVYVQLTGTAPQAFVSLKDECGDSVVMSDANYIERGRKRKALV